MFHFKKAVVSSVVFSCLLFSMFILGIENSYSKPPPWAPAHGYRAKQQYQYYPKQKVYYNPEQKEYFWLDGGAWKTGVELPKQITIRGAEPVKVEFGGK